MDRIQADHRTVKKLGHWTTARDFDVRARLGAGVLDLRAPQIPNGDIEVGLRWSGGGRAEDWPRTPNTDGRRIRLVGMIRDGEIREHRGCVAVLSAMFSREFVDDRRQANRTGTMPTVADPR